MLILGMLITAIRKNLKIFIYTIMKLNVSLTILLYLISFSIAAQDVKLRQLDYQTWNTELAKIKKAVKKEKMDSTTIILNEMFIKEGLEITYLCKKNFIDLKDTFVSNKLTLKYRGFESDTTQNGFLSSQSVAQIFESNKDNIVLVFKNVKKRKYVYLFKIQTYLSKPVEDYVVDQQYYFLLTIKYNKK